MEKLSIATLLITLLLHTVCAQQGLVFQQGERNLYGNNVTLRTSMLTEGAAKAFVDWETRLPSGHLKEFYIYAHGGYNYEAANDSVRLQIYRPIGTAWPQMLLVYEQIVEIDVQNETGALYKFPVTENFLVDTKDVIGWTFEGNVGPISFDYVVNHRTFFYNYKLNGGYPEMMKAYEFDEVVFPSVFSIAVRIDDSVIGNAGSTTATPVDTGSNSTSTSTSETRGRSAGAVAAIAAGSALVLLLTG